MKINDIKFDTDKQQQHQQSQHESNPFEDQYEILLEQNKQSRLVGSHTTSYFDQYGFGELSSETTSASTNSSPTTSNSNSSNTSVGGGGQATTLTKQQQQQQSATTTGGVNMVTNSQITITTRINNGKLESEV